MADKVQRNLEGMLPELEELAEIGIFTVQEVKDIIKKRTNFEYLINRRSPEVHEFMRYIEFELNLDTLIKKRTKINGFKLPTNLYNAGHNRAATLYEKATYRYPKDVKLWVQYINFCKECIPGRLKGAFARVLALHPTNENFWVEAAAFEMEENHNISVARSLMQRGLRMNKGSTFLWLEYAKLEINYMQIIKSRLHKWGLKLSSLTPKGESLNVEELPDGTGKEVSIEIPKGDPSGEGTTNENVKSDVTDDEKNNPFLQGAVVSILYSAAIEELPHNLSLRLKFLDLYNLFPAPETLLDQLYKSIEKDFPNSEEAWKLLALRYRAPRYETQSDLGVDPDKHALDTFNSAIERVPTSLMWENYFQFCLERLGSDTTKNVDWDSILTGLYQSCFVTGKANENIFLSWASFLLNRGDAVESVKTISSGLEQIPSSVTLWLFKIRLLVRESLLQGGKPATDSNIKQTFAKAFEQVPLKESVQLHSYLLELALSTEFLAGSSNLDTIIVYFKRAAMSLGKLADELKESILFYALATIEAEDVKKLYESVLTFAPHTLSFYRLCQTIERQQKVVDIDQVRRLFGLAVHDHGKRSTDLWLEYIHFERSVKEFGNANNIYWQATKVLDDSSAFLEQHENFGN